MAEAPANMHTETRFSLKSNAAIVSYAHMIAVDEHCSLDGERAKEEETVKGKMVGCCGPRDFIS